MSEENNLAKKGLEKFLCFNLAWELLDKEHGITPDGKIYSAGAKNFAGLAQDGLLLGAALTPLSLGTNMILNTKEGASR